MYARWSSAWLINFESLVRGGRIMLEEGCRRLLVDSEARIVEVST